MNTDEHEWQYTEIRGPDSGKGFGGPEHLGYATSMVFGVAIVPMSLGES